MLFFSFLAAKIKHFSRKSFAHPQKSLFLQLPSREKTARPKKVHSSLCRKVTYPSFHFHYENDGDNEKLLFGITGNRPATRMILLLNKDIISLPLQDQDSQTSWFRLSIEQLLQICTTQEIDLDTDLEMEDSIQYHELSAFASRFYNVVFNRLKFLYSVNIRLITDP